MYLKILLGNPLFYAKFPEQEGDMIMLLKKYSPIGCRVTCATMFVAWIHQSTAPLSMQNCYISYKCSSICWPFKKMR